MHPAKIISITGSSSKPIYVVRFKAGGDTETVFAHNLKSLAFENKKRKADGTPVVPPTPTAPSNPNIISAAADIDAVLASQVKNDASKTLDGGSTRPAKVARKVKANKELEAGKNKWQEFSVKGKTGKVARKDSMFRTGEGVNARGKFNTTDGCQTLISKVGFVGSGQDMRKDPSRKRHIYQSGADEEA